MNGANPIGVADVDAYSRIRGYDRERTEDLLAFVLAIEGRRQKFSEEVRKEEDEARARGRGRGPQKSKSFGG